MYICRYNLLRHNYVSTKERRCVSKPQTKVNEDGSNPPTDKKGKDFPPSDGQTKTKTKTRNQIKNKKSRIRGASPTGFSNGVPDILRV